MHVVIVNHYHWFQCFSYLIIRLSLSVNLPQMSKEQRALYEVWTCSDFYIASELIGILPEFLLPYLAVNQRNTHMKYCISS